MTHVPLLPTKISRILDEKIAASDVTEASSLSIVYTGADQTAQTPSKVGDIFVTDAGAIYIAKTTNPSTGWQLVPQT